MKTSILTFSCNLDVFMSHCKLDDADSIWTRPTERFFCLESTSNFLTYLELSKRRETNRQTSSTQSKLGPPTPFRTWSRHTLAFFVHAVRGRRSDGHQNVLWSVNYSQVVREQEKWSRHTLVDEQGQFCPRRQHLWAVSVFFWTMLRASLQLWQSLSCASIVIVRQRDQKERSGTKNNKATKQNKANKNKTPKTNTKTRQPTRPWPIE